MNALDELKSMNARQEHVDSEALLAALKRSSDQEQADLDEADEAAVRPTPSSALFLVSCFGCDVGQRVGERLF